MKNKFKLFDKLVYWEMINQIKISGFIATAIYFVTGIITSLGLWVSVIGNSWEYTEVFPGEFFYVLLGLVFIFVPIMTKSVFTYQNRRNASDFYHSLPIKREVMFVSSMAAILTWVVGIMIVSTILPVCTAIILPQYSVDFVGMFKVLGNILAMVILVMGGFSLGINLTGNNFTNMIVSVMILFVPRIISSAIYAMVQGFMPFLEMNAGISLINNSYNLLFGWFISMISSIPGQIHYMASWGYTVVLGIIYLALGALAHKHRKSEMAAQASAYRLVQPVTRMIPAFLFGLMGIFFFLTLVFRYRWGNYYDSGEEIFMYWGMFSMLILSLLSYVIYELITTRRWRKVAQSFKQLPILGGVIVISALLISGGINLSLNKEVDADKMKYIEVGEIEGLDWLKFKGEVKISDDKVFETVEKAYDRQMEALYEGESYWETYELVIGINQGGLTFYRTVYFDREEMDVIKKVYMEKINADETKVELPRFDYTETSINIYYELGYAEYDEKEVYNALRADLKNMPYMDVTDVKNSEIFCYVEVNLYGDNYFTIDVPITTKTPKTLEIIMECYENDLEYEKSEISSAINTIDLIVNEPEKAEGGVYLYSYAYYNDGEIFIEKDAGLSIKELSDMEKMEELLTRYMEEDGDVIFHMEGYVYCYWFGDDNESDIYFSGEKSIPKDLAEELSKFFESHKN